MTEPQPSLIGETLEQALERAIFSDPAVHALRNQWDETRRQEQAVFDRICREEYERRLKFHHICRTPNPEVTAHKETQLCTIIFREELDVRLALRWVDTLRRVEAVLADVAAAVDEPSCPGSESDY